jgi:hypothetical protein
MVYFRKSVDADRNVKVVKINKEYYIVVTEMATSVSAGTNRELHIRQPYEHMVEYHEFAKETSYCFCIDTKIVNIHQPMRPFADEGEKIVGVVLSRVRLATDLPAARLQSAFAALIEPASRAMPSKSPESDLYQIQQNCIQAAQRQYAMMAQMMAQPMMASPYMNRMMNYNGAYPFYVSVP